MVTLLKKLKEYGILKSLSSNNQQDLSDLIEEDNFDIMDVEKDDCVYVFKYVGIIIISNYVIKCYPKYVRKNGIVENDFKQIIQVIKKYKNSKKQSIHFQKEHNETSNFNMLSIMLYLIEDYYQHGLYTNSISIIESNGSGEILWDKTINEVHALIQKNRPYYLDYYTKKNIVNNQDYFRILHEIVLTKCSKALKNADLMELFDLTQINLNDRNFVDFDDLNHILYKLNQEIYVQFNDRKKSILIAMYDFITNENSYIGDLNSLNVYGTNAYNLVWEEMCGCVIDNKRDVSLYDLNLPMDKIIENYVKKDTLLSIIEKPNWVSESESEFGKRLIPDSITFNEEGNTLEFIIFDAKYYNWPNHKPGIGDIIKQYLYELAYKKFIELVGFDDSKNCFLFPFDGDEIENWGYVELKMLNNLGLKNIEVRLLPAKHINALYLENKKLNLSELNL